MEPKTLKSGSIKPGTWDAEFLKRNPGPETPVVGPLIFYIFHSNCIFFPSLISLDLYLS